MYPQRPSYGRDRQMVLISEKDGMFWVDLNFFVNEIITKYNKEFRASQKEEINSDTSQDMNSKEGCDPLDEWRK